MEVFFHFQISYSIFYLILSSILFYLSSILFFFFFLEVKKYLHLPPPFSLSLRNQCLFAKNWVEVNFFYFHFTPTYLHLTPTYLHLFTERSLCTSYLYHFFTVFSIYEDSFYQINLLCFFSTDIFGNGS